MPAGQYYRLADALSCATPRCRGCKELLSQEYPNITLLDAIRSFTAVERERGASITLAELFDSFRAARATKSASYKRDIRWASDRMAPFRETLCL